MKTYDRRAFLVLLALIGMLWLVADQHQYRKHDPRDTMLLLALGLVSLLGCAFMVQQTERWTIRALGLFAYVAGVGVLFTVWGVAAALHIHVDPTWITLARACFYVGVAGVAYGIVATIIVRRRERRERARNQPTGLP